MQQSINNQYQTKQELNEYSYNILKKKTARESGSIVKYKYIFTYEYIM